MIRFGAATMPRFGAGATLALSPPSLTLMRPDAAAAGLGASGLEAEGLPTTMRGPRGIASW